MSLVTSVTARPRAAAVRSALFRADRARLAAAGWKAEPVDPVAPAPKSCQKPPCASGGLSRTVLPGMSSAPSQERSDLGSAGRLSAAVDRSNVGKTATTVSQRNCGGRATLEEWADTETAARAIGLAPVRIKGTSAGANQAGTT